MIEKVLWAIVTAAFFVGAVGTLIYLVSKMPHIGLVSRQGVGAYHGGEP
jgi:uncharacterized membrane protein YjjB (DUF3815 family)